jgi:hypothetical protein
VADVGTIFFDGDGNVLQTTTVSLNGTIIPSRTATGTYTVNSDCTGSITLTLPPPAGVSQSNVVIVDSIRGLDGSWWKTLENSKQLPPEVGANWAEVS